MNKHDQDKAELAHVCQLVAASMTLQDASVHDTGALHGPRRTLGLADTWALHACGVRSNTMHISAMLALCLSLEKTVI